MNVRKMIDPPRVSSFALEPIREYVFPRITICPYPPWSRARLAEATGIQDDARLKRLMDPVSMGTMDLMLANK